MAVKVRLFEASWDLFINHKRKRKAKKIGTGPEAKRKAEDAARLIEARLAVGDLGILEPPTSITLGESVATWLDEHVALNLKGGTHRIYAGIMRNHWLPALGAKPLTDITRADIRQVITEKVRQGMSHTTAGHLITTLQSCLSLGEGEELIPRKPLRDHTTWLLKRTGKRSDSSTVAIFSRAQSRAIFRWFAEHEPRWYARVMMVLARTGMRLGEATALKAADLHFEARKIHVQRTWASATKAYEVHFNTPKSGVGRWVDMSLQLRDALLSHMERYRAEGGWVFYYGEGAAHPPESLLHDLATLLPIICRRIAPVSQAARAAPHLCLNADRKRREFGLCARPTRACEHQDHRRYVWPPGARREHRGGQSLRRPGRRPDTRFRRK